MLDFIHDIYVYDIYNIYSHIYSKSELNMGRLYMKTMVYIDFLIDQKSEKSGATSGQGNL